MDPNKKCLSCFFYKPMGPAVGECRKSIPTVQLFQVPVSRLTQEIEVRAISAWPPTKAFECCGEHKAAEGDPVPVKMAEPRVPKTVHFQDCQCDLCRTRQDRNS